MQATFAFSNKNNKSNKLPVNDSNYLDKKKLFINNGNYSCNNKLFIDDDNTFYYGGDVKMSNDTETSNTTFNNNFFFPDFGTMSQCNRDTYIAKVARKA